MSQKEENNEKSMKPVVIRMEELQDKINQAVEEAQLHYYLLDTFFHNLYLEIHQLAGNMAQSEKEQYLASVSNQEPGETEPEDHI